LMSKILWEASRMKGRNFLCFPLQCTYVGYLIICESVETWVRITLLPMQSTECYTQLMQSHQMIFFVVSKFGLCTCFEIDIQRCGSF
jgi:hypothetical protein